MDYFCGSVEKENYEDKQNRSKRKLRASKKIIIIKF